MSIISAILPLLKDIIDLAFIIFPSSDKSETAQADSDASVEERIHTIAENAFGEVDQIVYNDFDEFVRVIVVGSDNLSVGMTKSSWYMKQLDVL